TAADGPRRVPPETRFHDVARAAGQDDVPAPFQAPPVLGPEASGYPASLRPPPRAQRRPPLLGRPERTIARSVDQAAGDARRRSPRRVRIVRGGHPRGLWRRRRDALGY